MNNLIKLRTNNLSKIYKELGLGEKVYYATIEDFKNCAGLYSVEAPSSSHVVKICNMNNFEIQVLIDSRKNPFVNMVENRLKEIVFEREENLKGVI